MAMTAMMKRVCIGLGMLTLIGALSPPVQAADVGRQQRLVEQARLVLATFLEDPDYKNMRVYVQNAYGVMVVPDMLKGGFLIGAEHGVGVFMVRDSRSGGWGQPAFYDLYGGSLGLQFGGQSSDVVFTLMNPSAVDQMIKSGLKLGADAGVAAGRVGAAVGAATTTSFGEDLYVFARSQGLFGGFAIDGTYISPKDDWNRNYYGRPVRPEEVLKDFNVIAGTEVAALQGVLGRY